MSKNFWPDKINVYRIAIAAGALIVLVAVFYFLSKIFIGDIILSQGFNIGGLYVHYYGVCMAVAVLAGYGLARWRAKEYGFTKDDLDSLFLWLVIGGFVGARVYHVLTHAVNYWNNPGDIVQVWQGGLSIYGAILGGMVVVVLWCHSRLRSGIQAIDTSLRNKHMSSGSRMSDALLRDDTKGNNGRNGGKGIDNAGFQISNFKFQIGHTLDWLVPSVALGQAIGRFGNMFNYEAFGYPATGPWRFFVPLEFRPIDYEGFLYFHPFFLYEAVGSMVICIVLVILSRRRRNLSPALSSKGEGALAPRTLFLWYIFLYTTLRFFLEFTRLDSTYIEGVRFNAWVSLIVAIGALASLLLYRISSRRVAVGFKPTSTEAQRNSRI